VHGAGSTRDAVIRLLGPAAPDAELLAVDGRGDLDTVVDRIASTSSAVAAEGRRLALAGGISLGAHAVATWAAGSRGTDLPALVLTMPAWIGTPDAVAALTAASADEIEREGTAGILARLTAGAGGDWVVEELVAAWTDADPATLPRSLRAAASSRAPTLEELARIRARTVVVALADDPLHPQSVAEAWADAIPGARLVVVPRHAPSADRAALGRAAMAALDDL
jgi:pimeloyl-ACP methyl ester carboxylesterase